MPCSDGRDIEFYTCGHNDRAIRELQSRTDKLTIHLCTIMRILEKENLLHLIGYAEKFWWEAHKKLDEERNLNEG